MPVPADIFNSPVLEITVVPLSMETSMPVPAAMSTILPVPVPDPGSATATELPIAG